MKKPSSMVGNDVEVRELTVADMRSFKPAGEVLTPELLNGLAGLRKRRGERGAQKSPTKVPTTIRFDADVLAALKASGRGWQTRVNEAVKDWLKAHPQA